MKSSKLWRIIWIIGIYALLLTVLYLVVLYKVKWEHKDFNTYLYFYDCGRELCTSTNVQDDYYNKVLCENNLCPYIDTIIGDNLILKNGDSAWIYNYIKGDIVNNKYNDYRYIGDDMYVVSDNVGSYGVIDESGTILVDLKYNYIDDYKNGIISYVINNLYGVVSTNDKYQIDAVYDDVVLINDKIFAGKKNNIYQMHSYDDIYSDNANKYDFVYSYDDVVFIINDKKIDILDSKLDSTLLMKIDTFYGYTTEKERDSLEIYSDGENIYFKVFINDSDYTTYKYNIKDKKLL